MEVASLFAGAGGLDLGFAKAGFKVVWANEYDKTIWDTYRINHPHTCLDTKSITDIDGADIPGNIDGLIGGPPCQSWSLAGKMKGSDDDRGMLFYEYLRVLKANAPKFFVAENVPGIVSKTHIDNFYQILSLFEQCNYNVNYKVLNASDYGVPQDRNRVFIVGFRKDLGVNFDFGRMPVITYKASLRDAISDLPAPVPAQNNKANKNIEIPNHEYMTGGFSSIYMSRNRKRDWSKPSFTIQAGGRHAPLHPQAPPMVKVGDNKWEFDPNGKHQYRRLSVRECARIQTFPDSFIFIYNNLNDGYKMIGNAVPVELAKLIAENIKAALSHESNRANVTSEATNWSLSQMTISDYR